MHSRILKTILTVAVTAGSVQAQTAQRRAAFVGGSPDRGKCTVEVVVDGQAQVEIRGDTATLRNLKGQMPQWRRFECSGPLPANPADFRFAGVDGRGRQELIRDPRNGGVAIVLIEDPDNGSEGYTFDIFWSNGGPVTRDRGPVDRGAPDPRYGGAQYDRNGQAPGYAGRQPFSPADALRNCEDVVRQQAAQQYDARNLTFRRVQAEDNPGSTDEVKGLFDVRRPNGRDEAYRFSCGVNLESARVFNARIIPFQDDNGRDVRDVRGPSPSDRAIRACQNGVEQRIGRDGYRNVSIQSIRVDDQPGRSEWVVGNARADARDGQQSFTFSCSVNLNDGVVRTVDVQRR